MCVDVCMYVTCMYLYVYLCMHVCIYVCMLTCMFVWICMYVYMHIWIYLSTYLPLHLYFSLCMCENLLVHLYRRICTRLYLMTLAYGTKSHGVWIRLIRIRNSKRFDPLQGRQHGSSGGESRARGRHARAGSAGGRPRRWTCEDGSSGTNELEWKKEREKKEEKKKKERDT